MYVGLFYFEEEEQDDDDDDEEAIESDIRADTKSNYEQPFTRALGASRPSARASRLYTLVVQHTNEVTDLFNSSALSLPSRQSTSQLGRRCEFTDIS